MVMSCYMRSCLFIFLNTNKKKIDRKEHLKIKNLKVIFKNIMGAWERKTKGSRKKSEA